MKETCKYLSADYKWPSFWSKYNWSQRKIRIRWKWNMFVTYRDSSGKCKDSLSSHLFWGGRPWSCCGVCANPWQCLHWRWNRGGKQALIWKHPGSLLQKVNSYLMWGGPTLYFADQIARLHQEKYNLNPCLRLTRLLIYVGFLLTSSSLWWLPYLGTKSAWTPW